MRVYRLPSLSAKSPSFNTQAMCYILHVLITSSDIVYYIFLSKPIQAYQGLERKVSINDKQAKATRFDD